MPDGSRSYGPTVPDVAHESFEDEVILIHFKTGRYFRLDAAGRAAWSAIERGATVADVSRALGRRFDAAPEALDAAAGTLVDALLAESLVVPKSGAHPPAADGVPAASPAPPPPLAPPRLEVFTDLEDLLLLDPIHDIDESGWPHAKA